MVPGRRGGRRGDAGTRAQAGGASAGRADRVAGRIAEHATAHDLPDVGIVLHGGEPLLLWARRLEELLGILVR
ncbi:hypothetical protein PV726_46015, partial [Streptomyces europaeiscabiei]|nr:hypothetical protein [Streptomyces europaeiscabiei]